MGGEVEEGDVGELAVGFAGGGEVGELEAEEIAVAGGGAEGISLQGVAFGGEVARFVLARRG